MNIFQAAHGPDHPHVAGALVSLGIIQLRRGKLRVGFRNFERGMAISQADYGPGHIPFVLKWSGLQKIFSKLLVR